MRVKILVKHDPNSEKYPVIVKANGQVYKAAHVHIQRTHVFEDVETGTIATRGLLKFIGDDIVIVREDYGNEDSDRL